jgi:hypothetical protein
MSSFYDTSGQYPQPLSRVTWVNCPLVPGFTTARLVASLQNGGTLTVPSLADNNVYCLLENTGGTTCTLQFQQTQNDVSGPRSNIGAPVALVPLGRAPLTITPTQPYLEITATAGGQTTLRAQLTSQIQWCELGFSKSDPLYPQWIVQPNAIAAGGLVNTYIPYL